MSTINTSYAAMQYGMNTAQKIRQQDSQGRYRGKDKGNRRNTVHRDKKAFKESPGCFKKTERQIWEYGFFCFGYHR